MATTDQSVQERLTLPPDRLTTRDEALAAGGVRLPARHGAAPLRLAGRRRPRWVSLLLRWFT